MKLKGCEITRISHSPSGQAVAHVSMDNGGKYLIPFGQPVTLGAIVAGVQDYVDTKIKKENMAEDLNSQLMGLTFCNKKEGPSFAALWVRSKLFKRAKK